MMLKFSERFRGNYTFRILPKLQNLENDPPRLQRFKKQMLNALVKHAYAHVPYYHDLFKDMKINPNYADMEKVWSKLPVLKKETVRTYHSRLVADVPSKYVVEQTSGSSGEPLKILKDRSSLSFGLASYYEGLAWYGYSFGETMLQLWGRRPILSFRARIARVRNNCTNLHELDAHSMSDLMMQEYYERILKTRPKILYGYVSSLELFSRFMLQNDYKVTVPTVVTTAEKLLGYQRKLITHAMASQVFDQYGSSEATSIAYECPQHQGLHIMPKVILQVARDDGEEVAPGEIGKILVTDLTNLKMPLIKYEVGDLGSKLETEQCKCGRTLETLREVEGRTSDIIVGLNGNRVHGEFFSHLLESSGFADKYGVKQFQLVQKTREILLFRLSVNVKPEKPALNILNNIIGAYLGPVQVRYEFLSEIAPHVSGKYRFTISELEKNM